MDKKKISRFLMAWFGKLAHLNEPPSTPSKKTPKEKKAAVGTPEGNNGSSGARSKKQGTRNKFYCFTKFYESEDDIFEFENRLKILCKKFLYGRETCPSTGKQHLQGFCELKQAMRITELKLNNHFEKCKGTEEQNEKYCSKDNNITRYGYPIAIKTIETLRPFQENIKNICLGEPDGRSIHWFYETTGNMGKSAICKYMYVKHNTLIIQGGKLKDIVNLIYNTNMDECRSLIIDIPRTNTNKISYAAIECILNGMITNTKFETGVKVFNPPNVICLSNFPPEMGGLSKDRWKVYNIDENHRAIEDNLNNPLDYGL